MPAPLAIRDPASYNESQRGASPAAVGADPVIPLKSLRNLLTIKEEDGSMKTPTSAGGDEDRSMQRRNKHLVSDGMDISTSPRLLGYVFSFISSAVCTISATIFYFKTAIENPDHLAEYTKSLEEALSLSAEQIKTLHDNIEEISDSHQLYFGSGGNLILIWKVYACMAVSGLLTVITLAICIAHFDSIFCVKKNRISFADGSKIERNLLLSLIVLSVFALHASTSKYSVGEAQANVFFSTWTNFASCTINYEVWRLGSGCGHTFQQILLGPKRHWFFLALFVTVGFFSTIDFFFNIGFIELSYRSDCLDKRLGSYWLWLTCVEALACWGVVALHQFCKPAMPITILEGIISLSIVVVVGYIIGTLTGGRLDQVPCPSNLYFSAWIAFFLSVWIFGSMIIGGRSRVNS